MATAAAAPTPLLHPHLCRINPTQRTCRGITHPKQGLGIWIKCSDSSTPNRGFRTKSRKTDNKKMKSSLPGQYSTTLPNKEPDLSSSSDGKTNYSFPDDLEFQQRLQAVRQTALEYKKAEQEKQVGAIDYDVPTETNSSTIGMGTKIGVGVSVIAFGLVFTLGDFVPSGSVRPTEEAVIVDNNVSKEEREKLETRLKEFEQTLAISPEDSIALEGAAVTLAEMREYKRAAALLEILCEKRQSDPDAFRLLGEVKYELKDYEGSAVAYKSAAIASKSTDFEVLRGLTNALLAAKKPDEAVQVLLESRKHLNKGKFSGTNDGIIGSTMETRSDMDPIQVDLLLGKAYSDWGHISDAVSVYDQLISSHPDDFRGYLAKAIVLKENGSIGDAERMFIQARFFAPDKAKILVDKYSR